MAFATNKVGPSSYCITTTQGTSSDVIVQEIIRIAGLKNGNDGLIHGWELVAVEYNKRFVRTRVDVTFKTVAWFKSRCESGDYKYALICNSSDSSITILGANIYSEDMSSVIGMSPSLANTHYSWIYELGWINHEIPLATNDRYDFLLFINPKWMAFTTVPYSTKEATNWGSSTYSYQAFGLVGVFELYSTMPSMNFALVNTAMALDSEYWGNGATVQQYQPNGIAVHPNGTYREGMSGIKVANAGEIPNSNGSRYGGLRYCSERLSLGQVSMLDLFDSLNGTGSVYTQMKKIGSLHGLKVTRNLSEYRIFDKMKLRTDDKGMLNLSSEPQTHLIIPCYLTSNAPTYNNGANRYSTLLLPA